MGALITVQDLEAALGRAADDDQAEWEFYIDTLSHFINNFVDVSFEPVTLVTERLRADDYGTIKLKTPVNNVTSIKNFRSQEEDLYGDFDGIDTIFYLMPKQVVDITYSYGYNTVPDDIQSLLISAILAQINEFAPISLRLRKVGDVEEQYRDGFIQQVLGETAMSTLRKYASLSWTVNVSGSNGFPDYEGGQAYLNDF